MVRCGFPRRSSGCHVRQDKEGSCFFSFLFLFLSFFLALLLSAFFWFLIAPLSSLLRLMYSPTLPFPMLKKAK